MRNQNSVIRGKRMGTIIVCVVLIISVCLFCLKGSQAINIPQQVKNELVFVLSTADTAPDTLYVLEMGAFFRMYHKSFYANELMASKDVSSFREKVEEYRKKRFHQSRETKSKKPLETWDEVLAALAYGKAHFSTPIYAIPRDVRWDIMFNRGEGFGYGVPSDEWFTKGEYQDPNDLSLRGRSDIYILVWDWLDKEVVCHSDTIGGVPARIIPERELKTPEIKPIYPYADFAVFPNRDGTYDVWASLMITGDQFTNRSLDLGVVRTVFSLYRRDRLIASDTVIGSLSALRPLLHRADVISGQAVSGYLSCRNLKPGTYQAVLEIKGGHHNGGTYKKEIVIPSMYVAQGVSDLILTLQGTIQGSGLLPGIQRNGRSLYGDPMRVVIKDHPRFGVLHPYIEFSLPNGYSGHCLITVTIKPVAKSTSVTVGPIFMATDLQGREIRGGGKSVDRRKSDPVAKSSDRRTTLIYSEVFQPDSSLVIFNTPLDVRGKLRNLKPGAYWLKVAISGQAVYQGKSEIFSRSAELAIKIAK